MVRFNLIEFADTRQGALSGGNKRKLQCAIACLAQPKIVYIDEASAGVDPASRKIMWNGIRHETKRSAVVITTHAMEEAEALANRIGIMVAGSIKALGTLHELQKTYGLGYDIEFNFDTQYLMEIIEETADVAQMAALANKENVVQYVISWEAGLGDRINKVLDFEEQFSRGGLLNEHHERYRLDQPINVKALLLDFLVQNALAVVIVEIASTIGDVSIVQCEGTYVHLRLAPHSKSIGFVFGVMEAVQKRHAIKQYSCKESSLEMIFNSMAKEELFANFNRRITNQSRGSLQ